MADAVTSCIRVVGRFGGGCGLADDPLRARLRQRRIDPPAGQPLRDRRPQAELVLCEELDGSAELELIVAPPVGPEDAADCARALETLVLSAGLADPTALCRATVAAFTDPPDPWIDADDYFLPEPDLSPLHIDAARLERVCHELSRGAHV